MAKQKKEKRIEESLWKSANKLHFFPSEQITEAQELKIKYASA